MGKRKILGYVVFTLIVAFFLYTFIGDIISLKALADDSTTYTGLQKDIIDLTQAEVIFELIISIVSIGIGVYGLVKEHKGDGNANFLTGLAIIPIASMFTLMHGYTAVLTAKTRDYYETLYFMPKEYKPDAIVIWFNVLTIFGAVILLISVFVSLAKHKLIKKVLVGSGCTLTFVALTLSCLSGGEVKTTTSSVMSFVFLYTLIIISFIYALAGDTEVGEAIKEATAKAEVVKEPTFEEKVSTNNLDANAELRKLKKLLDEKVISQDEYDEKRKKYISLL